MSGRHTGMTTASDGRARQLARSEGRRAWWLAAAFNGSGGPRLLTRMYKRPLPRWAAAPASERVARLGGSDDL
jgi:hypothetical protein